MKKPPALPPWPHFSAEQAPDIGINPETLAAALNQRTPPKRSIQANIRLEFSMPQDSQIPDLDGELILQKPDQARLRTYTSLGTVAFDILYQKENLEIYLPQRKELVVIPLENLQDLKFGGIQLHLPQANEWWHMVEPWPGTPRTSPANEEEPALEILESKNSEQGILKMAKNFYHIDWRDGRIHQIWLERGLHLSFADWNFFQNHEYAEKITVYFLPALPNLVSEELLQEWNEKKSRHVKLKIKIKDLTENPIFPTPAFQSVDKSQLKITHLAP